jgi:flavin reductase (DIM6/NTAB) family NADH-FMN oxidoreductase RutF
MIDPIPVGKILSGLFVVTVTDGDYRDGFLASWIQQASFEPLMLSMAMKPDRPVLERIQNVGCFCVNIIGHHNNGVMKPFWGMLKPGEDPFTGLTYEISSRGNLLLPDAVASLECEVRGVAQPGDHVLVLAEVVETRLFQPEDRPMPHVRKTGLEY